MDNELIDLASSLIRIPSVTGSERDIISFLSSYLPGKGFPTEIMPSGSIAGIIDGFLPGPVTVLDGHIDTVGVGNEMEWSFPPFSGDVVDGMIRGRGASDMKCGVAASIIAASRFAGKRFPGRIIVACIVEEERFEGIASREISERFAPDFVIIAESTDGKLNIGQRGRAEIQIESYGRSCHSSNPEEGVNAIYTIIDAIRRIDSMAVPEHPVLGRGIMALTDIISCPYPGMSVIPSKARATYDRRTLPGETGKSIVDSINSVLAVLDAKASIAYGTTATYSGLELSAPRFFPSWVYSEDSPLVSLAAAGLKKQGLFKGFGHYSFCTNGSHYAGEKGIQTIGYGPGEERLAHTVDEAISVESLESSCEGLYAILSAIAHRDNA